MKNSKEFPPSYYFLKHMSVNKLTTLIFEIAALQALILLCFFHFKLFDFRIFSIYITC